MIPPGSGLYESTIQAERGEAGAQYSLGVLFLLGEGVKQDLEIAYHWLSGAASQNQNAQMLIAKVALQRPILEELPRWKSALGSLAKNPGVHSVWRNARDFVRAQTSRGISRGKSIWQPGFSFRGRSSSGEPVFEGRRRHAPFVDLA